VIYEKLGKIKTSFNDKPVTLPGQHITPLLKYEFLRNIVLL